MRAVTAARRAGPAAGQHVDLAGPVRELARKPSRALALGKSLADGLEIVSLA